MTSAHRAPGSVQRSGVHATKTWEAITEALLLSVGRWAANSIGMEAPPPAPISRSVTLEEGHVDERLVKLSSGEGDHRTEEVHEA
jgi:hypothetical protein